LGKPQQIREELAAYAAEIPMRCNLLVWSAPIYCALVA
jgi:hypothetical protein